MPRYVLNDSEDDSEPKTGRRTRAALASSTTDSPIRRSTRIRHGSVNPDGSSPESVTGTAAAAAAAAPVGRVTRRRAPAATANTLTVPEPTRALRSRKNSASSNISDNFDIESVPGTPKARANKRLSIVDPSPLSSPKTGIRTRRSTRASSETKSPQPVARITRRTRATSIDPEPTIERAVTPTKKRRQPVSALPSEPSLQEESNEDKVHSKINEVVEIPEPEIEDATSPEKTPSESSPAKSKKLSKEESTKEKNDDKEEAGELSEKVFEASLAVDKSGNESDEESELLKTPDYQNQVEDASASNTEMANSTKSLHSLVIKTKRHSLSDKSKELGMKIEDLLNKSTEEQETSPGNKENQKLNIVSPDKKVKKNIEFTVSNVSVVRGKSIGSTIFVNKSSDRKINTSLDERVSSKSRYEIVAPKSMEFENKKHDNSEDKSQPESVKSPKKNENREANGGEKVPNLKTGYTKIDETVVENEIIEEFTLYDSNDDDESKSEFSLTVEDDYEKDKNTSFSKIIPENLSKERKSKSNDKSDGEFDSDSSGDLFDKPNPTKIHSRKNSSEIIVREKEDSPKKRFSLNSKESGEEIKSEKKRKSIEIKEVRNLIEEPKADEKTLRDIEASNFETDEKSTKNMEENEPMETNELEETKAGENTSIKDQKEESSKLKNAKIKSSDQISDSDSNATIADLFQNISAEEWNNKRQKSPKEKRKSSLKIDSEPSQEGKGKAEAEENLISFEDGGKEASNSNEENKKKRKSNLSMENKAKNEIEGEKYTENEKEDEKGVPDVDDNISDAETIPMTTDLHKTLENSNSAGEETEKEEKPKSAKNSPKNKKSKSLAKSSTNSQKSNDYQVENSSDDEGDKTYNESTDEDEEAKAKPQRKRQRPSALDKLKTPLGRNYSIVAVADSDSGPDMPSSDNSDHSVPGFLFNAESSGDEEIEKNESHNTIDSDIAKDMNLAGENDLKYSDDDVPGDECRASESEHSDEEDGGSDIEDFVVDDDDVESSVYSEDDSEPKTRFKRILDKSSSEEEEEEIDSLGMEEDKSSFETLKPTELLAKKLEFSFESNKASSSKKREKESEEFEESGKKLKKSVKKLKSLLNETIDLCTPVQEQDKSPGLNTSAKDKSIKKLKKSLVQELATLTPEGNDSIHIAKDWEEEEEESMFTPETNTPKIEKKKTPKSEKKKERNSIQLMVETAAIEENYLPQEAEEDDESRTKDKIKTPKSEKKKRKNSIQLVEELATDGNDLTQEAEEEDESRTKTPGKDKKKTPKSEKKKRKNSIQLVEELATDENDLTQEAEEEEESRIKTPGKDKKKTPKSEKKKQRNSIQLVEELAIDENDLTQEVEVEEEEESRTKTPGKEKKKTPKSERRKQRDSMQLIEETALVTSKISELNQSMLTPNSESPVTKFLKKERLNESLPLLELKKKRASRSLEKKVLSQMLEDEKEEVENEASETDERKELSEESEAEESEDNDEEGEDIEEIEANGHNDKDEEEDDETDDQDANKEEDNGETNEENEAEEESEDPSEEEEVIVENKKKRKSVGERLENEKKKSTEIKSLIEKEEFVLSGDKRLAKRQSVGSSSTTLNGKDAELSIDDITEKKKRNLSNAGLNLENKKKRARLESSETPQGLKVTKKIKMAKLGAEFESDSDEAPESLGFMEARTEALQEMKEVAASLKAAKEAKKKKRREQLEKMRQEKEAKASKKSTLLGKTKPDNKKNLKRLPDDLLENLSDVVQRPQKKRKLLKKEEQELPSRYMFSPEKLPDGSLKIEKYDSSVSLGGSTTNFSVVNLEKVKKQPKKAAAVASFRERMLARNPRQPVSAFLMYQAKQKASGKHLSSRKQA